MKTLDNPIGLRAFDLGTSVIDGAVSLQQLGLSTSVSWPRTAGLAVAWLALMLVAGGWRSWYQFLAMRAHGPQTSGISQCVVSDVACVELHASWPR
jgi:hypothetical protein